MEVCCSQLLKVNADEYVRTLTAEFMERHRLDEVDTVIFGWKEISLASHNA